MDFLNDQYICLQKYIYNWQFYPFSVYSLADRKVAFNNRERQKDKQNPYRQVQHMNHIFSEDSKQITFSLINMINSISFTYEFETK